jgi:hypothetical protein
MPHHSAKARPRITVVQYGNVEKEQGEKRRLYTKHTGKDNYYKKQGKR